jgi:phosphate transport system permease protein
MTSAVARRTEGDFRPRRLRRKIFGAVFGLTCFIATSIGVVVLLIMIRSIVVQLSDVPILEFLYKLTHRFGSIDPERSGYKAGIWGTVWLLTLVIFLAIPVGVGAAVFLEEYPVPNRLRRFIQTNIANLAGVPSIVYGILGLALFARAFGFKRLALGPTLWTGSLTLGLLVLPVIVITTQEALRTVPASLRQGALALGASRWQVIRDHVLPCALPGIMTGTILAISRAIGETAPLLMVGAAASIPLVPRSPFDRYSALPVEIYHYAKEADPGFKPVASGGILILLAILFLMNSAAIVLRNRRGASSRS